MSEYIFTKGQLAFVFVVSVLIIEGQQALAAYFESERTLKTVTCIAQSAKVEGSRIQLPLLCSDQKVTLTDPKIIVSYFAKPGALTCRVHSYGLRDCEEIK